MGFYPIKLGIVNNAVVVMFCRFTISFIYLLYIVGRVLQTQTLLSTRFDKIQFGHQPTSPAHATHLFQIEFVLPNLLTRFGQVLRQ